MRMPPTKVVLFRWNLFSGATGLWPQRGRGIIDDLVQPSDSRAGARSVRGFLLAGSAARREGAWRREG